MNINITLPLDVEKILEILLNKGYEAYIVGGCVRDSILGRNPHDWDICTSAEPVKVIELFKEYKVIETGLKHGTVTIMMNHIPYEITTYRVDGAYSDNRRPDSVAFTTNIADDLSRRDFTINAIAFNPVTGIVDPYQGVHDIEEMVIRCVGDSSKRFQEDALRILRAMRFSIQLGFQIDNSTYRAMLANKSLVNNVSAERISAELLKMLGSKNQVLKQFQDCREIIGEFIPEFIPCFDLSQNNSYHEFDVYNHILHAVDHYTGDDVIIKLALLFHDIGKHPKYYSINEYGGYFPGHGVTSSEMTYSILKRLKFDNKTIHDVTELILYHADHLGMDLYSIKKWLNKIGETQLKRLLITKHADIMAQSINSRNANLHRILKRIELLNTIISEKQPYSIKDLAVNGQDLIDIGYEPGKQLGIVLNELLELVITNTIENKKEELLLMAEKKNMNKYRKPGRIYISYK